jgi:hypothetical protein
MWPLIGNQLSGAEPARLMQGGAGFLFPRPPQATAPAGLCLIQVRRIFMSKANNEERRWEEFERQLAEAMERDEAMPD